MTHETCLELLSDYRDDELAAGTRVEVKAHASSCAQCAGALADFERLGKALFRPLADSEAFVAAVMARLPEAGRFPAAARAPWAGVWRGWLTPALGFAFAAFLVVYCRPQPEETFPDEMLQAYSMQSLTNWSFPGASAVAEASGPAENPEDAL